MPILDIQRRFRELGRIRTGHQVPTGNTIKSGPRQGQPAKRPAKLPRVRLTSPDPNLIGQAAEVFGGTAQAWDNDGAEEYECFVEVDRLPVLIPPGVEILDQWYERWKGGGLLNRCDGIRQTLVDQPCRCPSDHALRSEAAAKNPPEGCKPTTRLRLMIPDISDVGIWRLETHGFHAAAELGGAAALVEVATRQGVMIPADLMLVAREGSRRPGQPRKKFFVPSISFRGTLGPTLEALGMGAMGDTPVVLAGVQPRAALNAGGSPELPTAATPFDPMPAVQGAPTGQPEPELPTSPPPPTTEDGTPIPEPGGGPSPDVQKAEPPAEELEPGDAFEPPEPVDETEAPPAHEGTYSPAQLIAMKFQDRGIKDRGEKLRYVGAMIGREIGSAKELTIKEASKVLGLLKDDDFELPQIGEPATVSSQQGEAPTPPVPVPSPAPEPIRGEIVDRPVPPELQASTADPGDGFEVDKAHEWDKAQWKAYLDARHVKIAPVIKEAIRLAKELDEPIPKGLDEFRERSESFGQLLAGFVEELHEEGS